MKLRRILLFNTLGIVLLISWGLPHVMLWTTLDDDIFWFFNQFISPDHMRWSETLAILNMRVFDAIAFGIMGLLFALAVMRDPRPLRFWRWLGIGVTMLLTAGLLALFTTEGIRYGHPSPTAFFANARHLTDVVSTIATKDSAKNSFPGDHGLMLMVFAAFMLRFSDRRVGLLSMAFVVLLSAPRIMVGAHWFSDVYMGSLTIALIALPWVLCTPLASRCVKEIVRMAQRFRLPFA
ncbi:phosphatase PAP2 family protein [Phytohalomonas tamaricis]|uniref:phosphatase PAP2 family protein n=1 Tax=Phytohalomonas tamaricis TaxID=2081032 RepID=UPI000D0B4BA0|nr:phosphatase PAP2 family protein [Phytohalomonas tamaricis]